MRTKTLFVIGIGPGDAKYLTAEAGAALEKCEFAAGYPLYLELIAPLLTGKELFSGPMGSELERCHAALSAAANGRCAALVCSGDAGVYGLAGLALELSSQYRDVEVVIVPGITAALSGAALLGSPLSNDFAVISLSDLLTPWTAIEKRLSGAAAAGFVICLYNPQSEGRKGYLERAAELILAHRAADTVCGLVHNAGRAGESVELVTLENLGKSPADMFTTVFVGNEATVNINGKMVTRRGYHHE